MNKPWRKFLSVTAAAEHVLVTGEINSDFNGWAWETHDSAAEADDGPSDSGALDVSDYSESSESLLSIVKKAHKLVCPPPIVVIDLDTPQKEVPASECGTSKQYISKPKQPVKYEQQQMKAKINPPRERYVGDGGASSTQSIRKIKQPSEYA